MHSFLKRPSALVVGALLLAALQALAGTSEKQPCAELVARAVLEAGLNREETEAPLRTSACKVQPRRPGTLLVAVVGETDQPEALDLVVGMFNLKTRTVSATYYEQVYEDAGFRVDENSLRLDTANYALAANALAFGLDITSGYIPHCGDADTSPQRTLYVGNGSALLPVLRNRPITRSVYLVRSGRCGDWGAVEPVEAITAHYHTTLSLPSDSASGLRDLVVTVKKRVEGGPPVAPKTKQLLIRFDGNGYPAPAKDGWSYWLPESLFGD